MQQKTTIPGEKLKAMINDITGRNTSDLLDELNQSERGFDEWPDNVKETVLAIYAYKKVLDETAYADTPEDHLYYLYKRHFFTDAIIDYKYMMVSLLKALTTEGVRAALIKEIGDSSFKDLVSFIGRFYNFNDTINYDNFRCLLLMEDVKQHDYSAQELRQIKEEYERKALFAIEQRQAVEAGHSYL